MALARIAMGGSTRVGKGDLLIGGEAKGYNGPWDIAERLRKFSGIARYSWERGSSQFSVLGMALSQPVGCQRSDSRCERSPVV